MRRTNFVALSLLGIICNFLLQAQLQTSGQVAAGQTSISSSFDPLQPSLPPSPLGQNKPVPRQPTVSAPEYASRMSASQARIPTRPPGPPQISFTNGVTTYTPDTRITALATVPTISFEAPQPPFPQDPPDPDMAAGPDDVILVENSNIARYTKAGQLTNRTELSQWFADQLPVICPLGSFNCEFFDPSIRYDQFHGRFLLSVGMLQGFGTTRRSFLLLAVSNSANYAGGWKNWALDASLNGATPAQTWADFPQLGFDNQAVYITSNSFSLVTDQPLYAKIRILKKSELYNPATSTLTYKDIFDLKNEDGTSASSIQPPLSRGRAGFIPNSYGTLVNASDVVNANYVTLWRIVNPVGPNPSANRITISGVWPYNFPTPAPQLGTPVTFDLGDSRVLKSVFRDGILFIAQNVAHPDEPTTVVYSRIDTVLGKLTLQARWTNGNFFFPAFDIPASLGPTTLNFPNKYIAGTTTDPTGALTFAGIRDVKAGEVPYNISSSGLARWGDYFGAAIDPQQGGMWTSGQFAKSGSDGGSHYGEWVAYFPWSTTVQFADVPSSAGSFNYVNVAKLWNILPSCGPSLFCPADPITRAEMATFVIRSIYGDSFSFTNIPYFTDVPISHPFFSYIQKLRDIGITSGCTATTFCPDATISREQMAVFVVRGKLKTLQGDNFSFPQTPYFTDVPATAGFFPYIQKLRELGITMGCSATQYCPTQAITREQAAIFIVRAFLN